MRLKSLAMLAVAAGLLLGFNARASADDYPNRSVKIIIAFSPWERSTFLAGSSPISSARCGGKVSSC